MGLEDQVKSFLITRRARLTPEEVGLPAYGQGRRRVPGLRREEVALLAGVSNVYYSRLERGHLAGVSDSVLDALARALRLDEAEREHLWDLARQSARGSAVPPAAPAAGAGDDPVRPEIRRLLAALTVPAYVRNHRRDILAANTLGRVLYWDLLADAKLPVNHARYVFLDRRAREFYLDWEDVAGDSTGLLRLASGRYPSDRQLTDLIQELATGSEDFRRLWAVNDVRVYGRGIKRLRHPVVGRLDLGYETMDVRADPGLAVITYQAEPESPAYQRLAAVAGELAAVEGDPAGLPGSGRQLNV